MGTARLIDRVAAAPRRVTMRDRSGKPRQLIGPGFKRQVLTECPVRYVLDADVSLQCLDLVFGSVRRFRHDDA